MLFSAIVLLLFVGTAHAQQPLTYTEAIVASIFGTLGVVLLCIALALLYFKLIKKKKKRNISNSNDVGHDNPVLSKTEDTTDANGKDHNVENGEVQTKPQDQNAQMYNALQAKEVDVDVKTPTDDNDVFTVLLDEKESPTNGFDLMPGENGNVQVANIRRNGPAHDKLKEGDIIESVTVFFDDITYQDALTLLSNSAPYKVAITASHNQRKEPETMTVTDEFQESAADAMLHAAPENRSPEDVIIPSNDEVPISYEELQTKSSPPNIGTAVLLKDDETKKSKLSHPSIDDDSKSTSSSSSYSSANDKNEHIYSKVSRRASTSSSSSSSDSDDEDRRKGGVGKDINGDREPTDVDATPVVAGTIATEEDNKEGVLHPTHVNIDTKPAVNDERNSEDNEKSSSESSDSEPEVNDPKGRSSFSDHTGGDDGSKKKVSRSESSDSEAEPKKPKVKTRSSFSSSSSSSSSDEENNDGRNGKEENSSVPMTVSQLNFKDTHSSSSSSSESDQESNISQDEITELEITPVEAGAETLDAPSTPIMTPSKRREDITFTSGWRKAVKLLDLIRAGLVRESTVKKLEFGEKEEKDLEDELQPFLSGRDPIAGLLVEETNKKISFYDACKKGIIRRGTAVSLLEAQAATGSIIDPNSAKKMSVKEATKCGLIDRQFQAVLERAERAVLGYKSRLSTEPMSLFDAMNRKLVVESHGIRLLEAQIATGGIIDPFANHRLPVEAAFERGLFDRRLEQILEDPSDDTKGFFDPNTNENLTYLELVERCVTDEETGLPLLQLVSKDRKKEYLSKYQPKFLS